MIDVKEIMKSVSVDTARGRAEAVNREIPLKPFEHEIEESTRARADGYLRASRDLSLIVQSHRDGLENEELESIEFIREQLIDTAKKVYGNLIAKG